jgi:hypothetical protein
MLTRSPVPPSPVIASPRSSFAAFHNASAASPHHSPSRVSVPQSRRQSATSSSASTDSPSVSRSKRYIGVDASTQYSPMEPLRNEPTVTQARPSSSELKLDPPPTPEPRPMVLRDDAPATAPASSRHAKQAQSVPKPPRQVESPLVTSPVKRRNSQGPGSISSGSGSQTSQELSTIVPQSPSTLAKRVKPNTAPPKLLPQKYENCAVEDMVVLIANMLGELIETNDALALKSGHLTRFHSRYEPCLSHARVSRGCM